MEKEQKTLTAKKLPGLFKKSYSAKSLENKIYKKVFVASDKEMIEKLFAPDPKSEGKKVAKFKIPSDTEIPAPNVKRLKIVAKQIKKQKGRFKAAPFIAVGIFIVALVFAVTTFKNPVLKKVIKNAMENIFSARCDIARVDFQIFNSKIEINGIQQASEKNPMQNIFEISKIDLDFNLTQLLRGRFDAENLEVSGIQIGTERKTSGALPPKKIEKKKEKQKKESKENDTVGFFDSLSKKSVDAATQTISGILETVNKYNPEVVLKDLQSEIKSPEVAKETEQIIINLIDTYKEKPAEIEKQIADFTKTAENLAAIDVTKIKDLETVKSTIQTINDAIETGKNAKIYVENTVQGIQSDIDTAINLGKTITETVQHDFNLASEKVSLYTSLSLDDGKRLLTGAFDTYLYEFMGKYYPYFQKAVNYAIKIKTESANRKTSKPKEKKTKKKQVQRLAGRNIFWKADTVPTLLIERVNASGSVGVDFSATATNISSDMDKRGKPIALNASLGIAGQNHGGDFIIDARTNSSAPLISGNYAGKNIPLKIDFSGGTNTEGVPKINGNSEITASIIADENFGFKIEGGLSMNAAKITATPFEPKRISDMYQNALSKITELYVGATIGFSEAEGLLISLNSDADKIILESLKSVLTEEIEKLKDEIIERVKEELEKNVFGANEKINEFMQLANLITDKEKTVEMLTAQIEAKKTELENKVKGVADEALNKAKAELDAKAEQAKREAEEKANAMKAEAERAAAEQKAKIDEAAQEAERKAREAAEKAAKEAEEKAKEKAKGAVKDMFKGFSR